MSQNLPEIDYGNEPSASLEFTSRFDGLMSDYKVRIEELEVELNHEGESLAQMSRILQEIREKAQSDLDQLNEYKSKNSTLEDQGMTISMDFIFFQIFRIVLFVLC